MTPAAHIFHRGSFRILRFGALGILLSFLCACAPAPMTELDRRLVAIEVLEAQGRYVEAEHEASTIPWQEASQQDQCRYWSTRASAQGGVGAYQDAITSFERARDRCRDPMLASRALFEMGRMIADRARDDCARGLKACPATPIFRRVVSRYPTEPSARRSVAWLREIAQQGGGASEAYEEMTRLFSGVKTWDIGAYLLFAGAELLTVRDGEEASRWARLALYRRILDEYPRSHLANDAMFESARLCLDLGRGLDALRHLRLLMMQRETSYLMGSYDSPLYARARFLASDAVLMATGNVRKAVRELELYVQEYPRSSRRGEALFRAYELWRDAGEASEAGMILHRLAEQFPATVHGKRARKILDGGAR